MVGCDGGGGGGTAELLSSFDLVFSPFLSPFLLRLEDVLRLEDDLSIDFLFLLLDLLLLGFGGVKL